MSLKNILFVDDEPNVLAGLRRMLHPHRRELAVQFAESGKEALAMMACTEFDVVVSDMQMPGMDGAELLAEIRRIHPDSVRIMLTGQADEKSILRTVGIAHQFLAKPCEPEQLRTVLLQAVALHKILAGGSLKKLITGIGSLPSVPEVYARLRRAMAQPEISIAEIAKIIEEDMAMSAKVLQLVNSSFFGLFQRVESPGRAVKLLGLNTVKGLVLGVGAFSEIQICSKSLSLQALWYHCMVVAGCAKKIALAESDDEELIENCFLAGLLHDIGKLILLAKMMGEYERTVFYAKEEEISLERAEKEIFAATHADVGAYLMGLWGLPGSVVEAIAFHHLDSYPASGLSPALAVQVANVFYYEMRPDEVVGFPPQLNMARLQELGLAERVAGWRQLCADSFVEGAQHG